MIIAVYLVSFIAVLWLLFWAVEPGSVKRLDGGTINAYVFDVVLPEKDWNVNYYSSVHDWRFEIKQCQVNVVLRKEPKVTEKGIIYI